MPYIDKARRAEVVPRSDAYAETPGELNFQITVLVDEYLRTHGMSYRHINDVLGALEGAKLEFYRRVAIPYEDLKLRDNGDVYTVHPHG